MLPSAKSIRSFIGAKDFQVSRSFYQDLGFTEVTLGPKMSYFKVDDCLGFYLQDYYTKAWIENSMIFLEVTNLEDWQTYLQGLELEKKYPQVRFTPIREEDWGRELFMHDPAGVLWHFGLFK